VNKPHDQVMAIVDGRTWLEILPEAECWRLLRLSAVGRLAVMIDGDLMIWPLNIAVDGHTIVFRTDAGSKVGAFQGDPRVAVEVDGLDLGERKGWSVVANGFVHELSGDELARARRLPLQPWTVGEKARWFGVPVARISGRVIGERAARMPVRDIR
jgi:nitroimidazol reductase NimA-like FMN-containing flavoprotein (pyridoxamine 5'-phosphate oxidase superfamily)